jgi:hypothetical protein
VPTDGASTWVADYADAGRWIAADRAVFARSENTRSPMGLDVVSFQGAADTAAIRLDLGLTSTMSWTEVLELVRRERVAANEKPTPALAGR